MLFSPSKAVTFTGKIVKNIMPVVREEVPEDYEPIRNLNRLAFGGNEEAELVDRLRSASLVVLSLVAVENDEIVGHILFSDLPIETNQSVIDAVSLAPMAVHPMGRHGRAMDTRSPWSGGPS
jgi:predicted N-acetyltransferase YhbS